MRVITALALFVCLGKTCLADDDWLTHNRTGTNAFNEQKWADALPEFEASWPLAKTPVQQAITANNLGACLNSLDRIPDALQWFQRSIALWRTQPGRSEELAETALGLTDVYRSLGRYSEAEQNIRSLLQVDLQNEHKAALFNTLGDMLGEQSRNQEALDAFHSAQALTGISGKRQFETWLGLADLDRGAGNRTAGLEKASRAIALARQLGAAESEALALRIQGLIWYDAGDLARAEPVLRRSLAIFQQQAPNTPRQIAAALSCLAELYRDQGKYSLAEQNWLQAMQLERNSSGDNRPQTAVIMESLAILYSRQKRHAEAADFASRASNIMSETLGPDSLAAAGALATIASVQEGEKHYEAAAVSYARALETFRAKGSPNDTHILSVMNRYAGVLASLHRTTEAKEVRQQIKTFGLR
jgi:tetratricopeptide (TPR) repeat protein